jgi:ergothioneine biosynthesis protein EgtB
VTPGAPPLARLEAAWERSDALFGRVREDSFLCQPIRLRQPILFYVGHLPAFAWNQLVRGVLGQDAFDAELDALFERGIDPEDEHDPGGAWPARERVLAYRDRVRERLRRSWEAIADDGARRAWMVLEHELMHHETLLYMLAQMPPERFAAPAPWRVGSAVEQAFCAVEGGPVVLGTPEGEQPFAWDNERPASEVDVPAFRAQRRPVTHRDLLAFVRDGGYANDALWSPRGAEWRARTGLRHPHAWRMEGGAPLAIRGLAREVAFDDMADAPASVSWAEADAYARWTGGRLPTEAEVVRFREGADPAGAHAGFDAWQPRAAGDADDVGRWGVRDAWGNGWEWTATLFAPFDGFRKDPAYPGYSADFFDGRHYVMRGGSWATDRQLMRPGFRNWFQPHYPFVFSKFRCVGNA